MNQIRCGRAAVRVTVLLGAGLGLLALPERASAQVTGNTSPVTLVSTIHNVVDLMAQAIEDDAPRKEVNQIRQALHHLLLAMSGQGKHHKHHHHHHQGAFGAGLGDFASATGNAQPGLLDSTDPAKYGSRRTSGGKGNKGALADGTVQGGTGTQGKGGKGAFGSGVGLVQCCCNGQQQQQATASTNKIVDKDRKARPETTTSASGASTQGTSFGERRSPGSFNSGLRTITRTTTNNIVNNIAINKGSGTAEVQASTKIGTNVTGTRGGKLVGNKSGDQVASTVAASKGQSATKSGPAANLGSTKAPAANSGAKHNPGATLTANKSGKQTGNVMMAGKGGTKGKLPGASVGSRAGANKNATQRITTSSNRGSGGQASASAGGANRRPQAGYAPGKGKR